MCSHDKKYQYGFAGCMGKTVCCVCEVERLTADNKAYARIMRTQDDECRNRTNVIDKLKEKIERLKVINQREK
jgi:hypothetical protein